jgi:hypothetical protein
MVTQYGPVSSSRYIFLNSPWTGPDVGGAIIIDSKGELVWFRPDTSTKRIMNFNVQSLNGEPVLTWFQGRLVRGHLEGVAVIADNTYTIKHIINAHNGLLVDLHEFFITSRNTAIISALRLHSGVDLTAVGGPASGYVLSGVFQEIDITTGRLIFGWDSIDHVPVTETYMPLKGSGTRARPFDYFHVNSICTDDSDGNYIVSGRHTWTIYKISATDGSILWRMNGKSSDFTMGAGAKYYWQHHVRSHGNGVMTIFDNGSAAPDLTNEPKSRALFLDVDETKKLAKLKMAYTHPREVALASAMGSVQPLPEGDVFVDWGNAARFSQFTADGTLLLDGRMNPRAPSYRGFSNKWEGHPATSPVAIAKHSTSGVTVYVSWNGATDVASWTIYAGTSSASLGKIGTVRRTGFETKITVSTAGPYFVAQANDAGGKALARSRAVKIA